jgi:hypothetical protein
MAGALTLLVLVGGAAAAETVQSSEGTVYTLPANVSRIEEYAFYGDGELREIRIPEGVTEIGDYAFCKLLVSDGNHDSGECDQDWRTCL